MTESMIAGTELKLTARVSSDGDFFTIAWDKFPVEYIFHAGFAAVLRIGSGDTEGMVELTRAPSNVDAHVIGHVEPLLSD